MVTYLGGGIIEGTSTPLSSISKDKLKAYYTMDEASGDLVNTASAIGSSHAISNFNLSVTSATQNVTGKLNKCVSFTGNNKAQADDSNLADTNFISQTGAIWTICLWVKLDNRVGDQMFLSTFDANTGEAGIMFRLINSSGGINVICGGVVANDKIAHSSTSAVIPNTSWNFVMAQYSDTTGDCKVSVNNGTVETIASSQNLTNTVTPTRKLIVGNSPQLDNDLNGDIDEISIWNRILTATEITAIYNSGTGEILSTIQTVGASEKDSVTDIPSGTRWHETDTKKIFRYGTDLVDGDGLKCYIKFDDASGNPANTAGDVAGNDTLGSSADMTITGTGTIDYETTGLPSELETGMEFPSTSATSGRHGVFGSSLSQFNFLHGGGTSTTFTICFWAKYPTTAYNNQCILRTNEGDTGAGINLYHYQAPSGGSNGDGAFRLFLAKQGGGNNQPIQGYSNTGFFLFDDAWHFYSFQCNWASSPILKFRRDYSDANQTFAQNGSNVPDAITQNSPDPLCFRQDSSQRNVYVPPTAEYAEMSIWDRRLTDAEVLKIYNSGDGFQLESGLTVWMEKGT